jgi:hypothetical protein
MDLRFDTQMLIKFPDVYKNRKVRYLVNRSKQVYRIYLFIYLFIYSWSI